MPLNVNECKEILKIKETLSDLSVEEADKIISKAFRREIRKFHPDSNPHLDTVFANKKSGEINNAYEYLNKFYVKKIDPEKSQYAYEDGAQNKSSDSQSQKQSYKSNDNYNKSNQEDTKQKSSNSNSSNSNSSNSNKSNDNYNKSNQEDTKQKSSNSNSSNSNSSNSNSSNSNKSNDSGSNSSYNKSKYDYDYNNSNKSSKSDYEYKSTNNKYSNRTKFKDDNIFKKAGSAVKDFFENIKDYFADLADDFVYSVKENAIKVIVAGLVIGGGVIAISKGYIDMNKEDDFVFEGGHIVNMEYAKWHFALSQIGRNFDQYKKTFLPAEVSKEEFINLFADYKTKINSEFETKDINIVFCENETELADKKLQFNQILDNGESYSERQIFVLEKDTYTAQEAQELFETLLFNTLEEYFRENIGMVKAGSLLDNVMLNDYDSSDDNFATLLADIYIYNYLLTQSDWKDDRANLLEEHYRNILIDVYALAATKSYENYIMTLDDLLKVYFDELSKKYDIELTEEEMKSSALYSSLYALNHYYTQVEGSLIKNSNYPRYADLVTGMHMYNESMVFESRLTTSTRISIQIENVRKTLGKELADENYEYLEENVAPLIANLLAVSKVGYYTSYDEKFVYDFIVDYKNFITEEQANYYGLRDPIQEFYNAFGYENYEEYYERTKQFMSSTGSNQTSNQDEFKQAKNHDEQSKTL